MKINKYIVALGALGLVGAVNADSVDMQADGLGMFTLESGNFGNLLDNNPSQFKAGDLNVMHEALHGDGISTDGFVTVLFAQTDRGLTMLTLVDDNTQHGQDFELNASVGFDSSINNADAALYINDINQDMGGHDEGPGGQSTDGEFVWSKEGNGDAMAWAGMSASDMWSVSLFDDVGGALDNGFQFVTWNGEAWEVLATAGGFGDDGSYTFGSSVIPLPAAFGLGIAGLAAVALRRRRQKVKTA